MAVLVLINILLFLLVLVLGLSGTHLKNIYSGWKTNDAARRFY